MNLGIYRIKNIKNGKFYIGSTNNLIRRNKEHFSLLKRNKNHCKILQRAYNKYGEEAFTFEVLAYCPKEYLFKLEQWFVDTLKPQYNSCLIDVSVPIGLSGTGYLYTDEHKEIKRKEAFTKLNTIDNFGWKSRVIEKLNDNKDVVKEYSSLKEYATEHNCSIGNVGKALKKRNKCKGFYIRYKETA
jgi:hypothetical protein